MESLPVEVVGNIFTHLAAAKDVVVASGVCKKWRDAAQRYVRSLRFSTLDWPGYGDEQLSTREVEVLITQTILQTSCLSSLSICIGHGHKFSAAAIIAWLMHTRATLQSLTFMTYVDPMVNLLDRCGRNKLVTLVIGQTSISEIDVAIHRFPCLSSLTLKRVTMTSLDFNLLVAACPKLEFLSLVNSDPSIPNGCNNMKISSSSLKNITFEDLNLDSIRVTVEAEQLESLFVRYSTFEHLEVVSRKSLKELKMAYSNIFQLDIGNMTDLLEVLEITGFTLTWAKLHPMLLRSPKLRTLRLWASPEVDENVMDIQSVAVCFPKLTKLALSYDLTNGLDQLLKGPALLKRVSVMELGSDELNEVYCCWISALLERCPCLRRLVIHGRLSETSDYADVSTFMATVVNLARKYPDVHVRFDFS